jgi:integrase
MIQTDDETAITITLINLFDKYAEFKKTQVSETTFAKYYQGRYRPYLVNTPQNLNDPAKIIEYLNSQCCVRTFQSLYGIIDAMIEWGKKRNLVHEDFNNKFLSIAKDYKVKRPGKKPGLIILKNCELYTHDKDYRAYTYEEAQLICHSFEELAAVEVTTTHTGKKRKISNLQKDGRQLVRDYLKFKFLTGCRGGEASALRWCDIDKDFEHIVFRYSYCSYLRKLKALKTEYVGEEGTKSRKFPCGEHLASHLESLKSQRYQGDPEDFVFKKLSGLPVTIYNLHNYWYGTIDYEKSKITGNEEDKILKPGIVSQLFLDGKITDYLTPYATRHTWITCQLLAGVHITNIAKLAGNSPQMILNHYSGFMPNMPLAPEIW